MRIKESGFCAANDNAMLKTCVLTGVAVKAKIVDLVAEVTIKQHYINFSDTDTMEASYVFPIHPSAAIVGFEARLKGRTVVGIVKDKEAAEKDYKDAVSKGDGAYLMKQQTPETEDVFQIKVGNLPAKTEVDITIKYICELKYSVALGAEFVLPTSVAPRYSGKPAVVSSGSSSSSSVWRQMIPENQNPDPFTGLNVGGNVHTFVPASVPAAAPFNAATGENMPYRLTLDVEWDFPAGVYQPIVVTSPSHSHIGIEHPTPLRIRAQMMQPACLDNDFVLWAKYSYTDPNVTTAAAAAVAVAKAAAIQMGEGEEQETERPRVSVEYSPDGKTIAAMLAFTPAVNPLSAEDAAKNEYVIVVDCSGSMGDMNGLKMMRAKDAVKIFLKSLPVGCRFNVVKFGSKFEFLKDQYFMLYCESTLNMANAWVDRMDADMGGTELLQPLQALFSMPLNTGCRARKVFIITDGQISDVEKTCAMVRSYSAKNRLFALGIGNDVSHALVTGIARAGKGTSEFALTSKSGEHVIGRRDGDKEDDAGEVKILTAKVLSQLKNAMQQSLDDVVITWKTGTPPQFEDGGMTDVEKAAATAAAPLVLAMHLAICDGCRMEPIVGVRMKCTVCLDYDLCSDCMKKLLARPTLHPHSASSFGSVDAKADPKTSSSSIFYDGTGVATVPSIMPPIFDGTSCIAYALFPADTPPVLVSITAARAFQCVEYKLAVPVPQLMMGVPPPELERGLTIHRCAARKLIRECEDSLHDGGNAENAIVKKNMVAISTRYNVLSSQTAFIAVERRDEEERRKTLEANQMQVDVPTTTAENNNNNRMPEDYSVWTPVEEYQRRAKPPVFGGGGGAGFGGGGGGMARASRCGLFTTQGMSLQMSANNPFGGGGFSAASAPYPLVMAQASPIMSKTTTTTTMTTALGMHPHGGGVFGGNFTAPSPFSSRMDSRPDEAALKERYALEAKFSEGAPLLDNDDDDPGSNKLKEICGGVQNVHQVAVANNDNDDATMMKLVMRQLCDKLIKAQAFDGHFEITLETLAKWCQFSPQLGDRIAQKMNDFISYVGVSQAAMVTAIIINIFEQCLGDFRDEWELLIQKAIRYVQAANPALYST
jgi:hypothetical protein